MKNRERGQIKLMKYLSYALEVYPIWLICPGFGVVADCACACVGKSMVWRGFIRHISLDIINLCRGRQPIDLGKQVKGLEANKRRLAGGGATQLSNQRGVNAINAQLPRTYLLLGVIVGMIEIMSC